MAVAPIGPAEADAITLRLQDVSVVRPLTHDLLRNVIETLGGRVQYVLVNDVANDTFFARIILDVDGRTVEIDSRPSDAIALAVRTESPIYADETVLARAGVLLDDDNDRSSASELEGAGKPTDPAELERLGAFKDFIDGLDLSDFDQRKR